jgi:hypothetical protein
VKALLTSGITWLKINVRNKVKNSFIFFLNFHTSVEFVIPYAYNFGLNIFFVADGDDGMKAGSCANRGESPPLDDKIRSLVLVNYFRSIPMKELSCEDNSGNLINILHTCDGAAASRWANFVAVDYYKVCLSLANYLIFSSSVDIDNRTEEVIIICFFLCVGGCRGVKEEDHFKPWTC